MILNTKHYIWRETGGKHNITTHHHLSLDKAHLLVLGDYGCSWPPGRWKSDIQSSFVFILVHY